MPKKFDPAALIAARLYPDMYPFRSQVQVACDFAKVAFSRLSGSPAPSFPDNEKSFAKLKQRIAAALAYIASVPDSAIDGTEEKTVSLRPGGQPMIFHGRDYLAGLPGGFAIPSMVFHVATAFGILRHNGVEIGKADFFGNLPQA